MDFVRKSFGDLDVEIVVANTLEIKDRLYTGYIQPSVNNDNLVTIVQNHRYLCGKDEKRILELKGLYPAFSEKGLFIFGNI